MNQPSGVDKKSEERASIYGRIALPLAVAVACGFAATTVMAQEGKPSPEATGLEEIIVTAQFREEKLQETPIAITAITSVEIQARSFTDSYEIGYTVPNASFRPAQAAYGNTMTAYIRGVGQNDFD
jgi:iron complex outermembrane recepter protein